MLECLKKYSKYFEPFVGGGTIFMILENPCTTINDCSEELISSYLAKRDNPTKLMQLLDEHQRLHALNIEKHFYEIRWMDRDEDYYKRDYIERAARMIYLNKTCFNGLYRVNSKGYFNSSFNGKLTVNTYDKDNILNIHKFLSQDNVHILNGDFEQAIKIAQPEGFIFFDPPYDLLKRDTFSSYNKVTFGVEGQKRLAKVAHELKDRGCYVMVTNHNTSLIRELYSDFKIDVISVKRMINSDSSNRVGTEAIIYGY